jgi:hypothetical protein
MPCCPFRLQVVYENGLPERRFVMSEMMNAIFDRLDDWRHLPNYQLERRADIFFSMYLKGFLEQQTNLPLSDIIIPEFPLKRDLIWPDLPTNKSVKVDYVLFTEDKRKVLFVELKTDSSSRRDAQDEYLSRAKEVGFHRFVEGFKDILLATSAHQKYFHLAKMLADTGFLRLPDGIEEYLYPSPRPGLTKLLKQIKVTPLQPEIEILYLQPISNGDAGVKSFDQFAAYVAQFGDTLSQRFAQSLKSWQTAAGSATGKK